MAEGVLYDLAGKVLSYFGESAYKEVVSWRGARDDLKKLEKTMKMIQARVRDAERHQEEEGSEAIKEWLCNLRKVLYQVDDLFDLVKTVDHQKQKRVQVNKQVCHFFSRSGTLCFNWKIYREIKSIRQQLDEIKSNIDGLKLISYLDHRYEAQPSSSWGRFVRDRETGSFVNTEEVIGRETDKTKIVRMLFDPSYDDEKRITVIPIVGFGGLGKTTLAQLVYNDKGVQNHFNLTAWACVPEIDNQNQVLKKVCQSLCNDKDSSQGPVDHIKSSIRESIKDNKYLLVLDDIWDESRDHWLDLLSLLHCGATGSRVMVTTRSANVARAVGTTEPHNLGLLPEEESWNLFKKFAFVSENHENNPNLAQIGKDIVDSCGNVPLAIRVVGSLLYSENSEKHWKRIRDNQRLKAKGKADDNIMQVLKLSYDYLPPKIKQCFAYCSLFPKDYEYRKDVLVKMWMAQGFIDGIDTGEEYFMELLGRNLFQDLQLQEEEEEDEEIYEYCKMHDLVHDLAQKIAGEEIKGLVEPLDQISFTDGLIHVSVEVKSSVDGEWEVPASLLVLRKMRSLILFNYSVFNSIKESSLKMLIMKFLSLRVLDLAGMDIFVVPKCIGKLKHLRYLNLAKNGLMQCLPDDITRLHNLQALNLVGCDDLIELPRDFCKLESLSYLGIVESGLSDLPTGLGKMKSLKELDVFIVGENNGIDSLPPINYSRYLDIKFCKLQSDAVVEAEGANLKHYHQLTRLLLDFSPMEMTFNLGEMDSMLLCLQLPPNLKFIKVISYHGNKMPRKWFDGLSNKLISIEIGYCSNCKVLPHLSRLLYLEKLVLTHLYELEYVEDEDDNLSDGGTCGFGAYNVYFPSLEFLQLCGMRSLKGLIRPSKADGGEPKQLSFPRLLINLYVDDCPKLMSMPLAPKLESLKARKINWKVVGSNLTSFPGLYTSLIELVIDEIEDVPVPLSVSSKISKLKNLEISNHNELTSLMIESSLRHLEIKGCKRLKIISVRNNLFVLDTLVIWANYYLCDEFEEEIFQSIACLTTLRKLAIGCYDNLKKLPEEIGKLSLLRELEISNCPKLASLPQSLLGLTSLQTLHIAFCPMLEERYGKPNGQDCHLLQNIPDVKFYGYPLVPLPPMPTLDPMNYQNW